MAQYFLKVLTNKQVARYYNRNGQSPKQHDQWLLTRYFAPYIYDNSTTHDSYLCYWLGGEPCKSFLFELCYWKYNFNFKIYHFKKGPTQRPIYNCFVGCSECCEQIEDGDNFKYNKVCPKECRPKDHKDWIYC